MKLAICDDDKRIRRLIAEAVREVSEGVEIEFFSDAKGILSPGFDADILFLDIQMPGIDGMRAARLMRSEGKRTVIVFETALEEQVFDAFEVGAFNYIVKPFGKSRIREVIKSAIGQAKEQRYIEKILSEKEEKEAVRTITVKSGKAKTKVILSEIAYAEIFDRQILLHMANTGAQISYYGRISELENIAGRDFYRVHRAYLINLAYVKAYDSHYVSVCDARIPVARGRYQELVRSYLSYYTRLEGL